MSPRSGILLIVVRLLVLHQAADDDGLAVADADAALSGPLGEDRRRDAAG